jgi:hypothetical protein
MMTKETFVNHIADGSKMVIASNTEQDAKRYRYLYNMTCKVGTDSEKLRRLTYNQVALDTLIEDERLARNNT